MLCSASSNRGGRGGGGGGGRGSGAKGVVIGLLRPTHPSFAAFAPRNVVIEVDVFPRCFFGVGQWRTGGYDVSTYLCVRRRQGLNTQCSPPSRFSCCIAWHLVPCTGVYVSRKTFFFTALFSAFCRDHCARCGDIGGCSGRPSESLLPSATVWFPAAAVPPEQSGGKGSRRRRRRRSRFTGKTPRQGPPLMRVLLCFCLRS